jgi:hypothetical protein
MGRACSRYGRDEKYYKNIWPKILKDKGFARISCLITEPMNAFIVE